MKPTRKTVRRLRRIAKSAMLMSLAGVFLVYLLGPIYWMVATSLMPESEIFAIPPHAYPNEPTIQNYQALLGFGEEETRAYYNEQGMQIQHLVPSIINSMETALLVAIMTLLVSAPAAYSFARLRYRLSMALLISYMALRTVPGIVLVVPIFVVLRNLGLIDTTLSLILVYCTFTVPFSIWLLQAYFKTIPVELEEAAWVDGWGKFSAATRVLLPLALPGLVAVFILAFMASWSEFIYAVTFTKTVNSQTVTVISSSFVGLENSRFDLVLAAGVLASLPPFLFALVVQRFIVVGFAAGALKG